MHLKRRPAVTAAVALVLAVLAGTGIWLGVKAQRAASNIGAIVVTPATLPSPPPITAAPAAATAAPNTAPAAAASPATTAAPAVPTTAPPADDQVFNILLLGTDRRPDQLAGRTDAVAVARIDMRTKRAALLSFPRDMWVTVPGYGEERINGAYFVGETAIGKGYGPVLAKQTMANLIGMPVEHFVIVNLEGFTSIVDTIGGVRLDIPEPIDDDQFPTEDGGVMRVQFAAGCQTLDGERALQYVRTRHQDSDFKRIRRQQQVLSAIFNTVKEQGLLTQINNVDVYTDLLKDNVQTDMSVNQLLAVARFGASISPSDVHRYQIDSFKIRQLQEPKTFEADPLVLKSLVEQFAGTAPEPPAATVQGFLPSTAAAVQCK